MLRIPDSDWRTVDGGPQISVAFLRKVTPQAARFTQWVMALTTFATVFFRGMAAGYASEEDFL